MAGDEGHQGPDEARVRATGERSDHRTSAPGVELPGTAEARETDSDEDEGSQPAENVPDEDAATERGDE